MLEAARAAMPELPAARAERFERELGLSGATPRGSSRSGRARRLLRGGAAAADGDATAARAGQLGRRRAACAASARDADPGARASPRRRWPRCVAPGGERKVGAAAARQVLDRLVAEGGDPEAIVEREGLGAMGGGDELAGDRRPRRSRRNPTLPRGAGRQRQGDRPDRRPGDARDEGPRRRRRGHRLMREQLGLGRGA